MPLATVTMGTCRGSMGASLAISSRVACEGVAVTMSSVPWVAASSEAVAEMLGASFKPGR